MSAPALPRLAEEIANWKLEDKIAALLCAVIFTSDHIEMGRAVEVPAAASLPEGSDTWNPDRQKRALARAQRDRAAIIQQNAQKIGTELQKGGAKMATTYPDQNVLYHVPETDNIQTFQYDISEIDFDTVAVAIAERRLYVACNYKTRSMQRASESGALVREKGEFKIQYLTFGQIRPTAIGNAMGMIRGDLKGESQPFDEVAFLGFETAPTNETEAAAPHAEMQIVSYLVANSKIPSSGRIYFGVSKPCCSRCAGELKSRGYLFRTEANKKVTNFKLPSEIQAKVVSTHKL